MLTNIFGERLWDDLWDTSFEKNLLSERSPLYGKHAKNLMKTDIQETENGYALSVDLPGFKKDEVDLQLQDGYLTIQASKGLDKDETDKKGNYIRRERYAGSCMRSFYVGDVKPAEVKATYENGVLTLLLPKQDAKRLPEESHIAIE